MSHFNIFGVALYSVFAVTLLSVFCVTMWCLWHHNIVIDCQIVSDVIANLPIDIYECNNYQSVIQHIRIYYLQICE